MGPSRKELIAHLVALIAATQDLTRATEESTREYRALREEIARLDRRARDGRPVPLARAGRAHAPGTVTALRVRRPG
jgi:hypothetical protein